jgi:hypothetical protein
MLVWLRQPSRFSRVAALSDRLRTHLFALPGVSVVPALIACASRDQPVDQSTAGRFASSARSAAEPLLRRQAATNATCSLKSSIF